MTSSARARSRVLHTMPAFGALARQGWSLLGAGRPDEVIDGGAEGAVRYGITRHERLRAGA